MADSDSIKLCECGCGLPCKRRFVHGHGGTRNLASERFGRLIVVERSGYVGALRKRRTWRCRCDCGAETVVMAQSLTSGLTKSCGCLDKETKRTRNLKHDMSRTNTYRIWIAMRGRCNNPNNSHYYNYGGRGISVCERWDSSFESFYSDMGPRPSLGHSIDRISSNGNYEPNNCRWATRKEQNNNTRRTPRLSAFGKTKSLADWATECGLSKRTIEYRVKAGWSAEDVLTKPPHFHNRPPRTSSRAP